MSRDESRVSNVLKALLLRKLRFLAGGAADLEFGLFRVLIRIHSQSRKSLHPLANKLLA